MNIYINDYLIEIEKRETNIYGLSFEPQMVNYDNTYDLDVFTKYCSKEVSENNFNLTSRIVKDYMTSGIIEIGVSRNGQLSFTNAILQKKPDNIPYLGIDLEDKSYLDDKEKNIFTIIENSYNQQSVRNYLREIGMEKISILFIDGDHSVNTCINDWKYADLLDEKSIVILHDTNYHAGPRLLIESIDRSKFNVERYFVDGDDYGMSIAYKL